MKLLVTGGYFDATGEGFVDRLDPMTGRRERVVSFVPPERHFVPGKGFTGADWLPDGSLLVCSFDSVWRFDLSRGGCSGQLHQADFNDLHGVCVAEDRIHVCNTGLDAVETFDLAGQFVGRVGLTPGWFEAERLRGMAVAREDLGRVLGAGWHTSAPPALVEPGGEYYSTPGQPFHRRKVRDYAHPNDVTVVNGGLAVTLLATCEVRCLRTFRPLARLPSHPHDGLLVDDRLWVTTIDGRVWSIDVRAREAEPVLVLDTAAAGHVGWCRGLAVGPDWVAVGLTEIRSAPRYPWRDGSYARTETSVLWLDRGSGQLLARMELTDPRRHSKVFALLASPEDGK